MTAAAEQPPLLHSQRKRGYTVGRLGGGVPWTSERDLTFFQREKAFPAVRSMRSSNQDMPYTNYRVYTAILVQLHAYTTHTNPNYVYQAGKGFTSNAGSSDNRQRASQFLLSSQSGQGFSYGLSSPEPPVRKNSHSACAVCCCSGVKGVRQRIGEEPLSD